MPKFTFVHAADLHLGAPFRGLDAAASEAFGAAPGTLGGKGNLLAEAGFKALEKLERTCLETGAAFLILAGDIYDDADGVLRARFALRDTFARLEKAGVRVFIAHGNHDPLHAGPLPVAWPDNVTVFGPEPESHCVTRDGEPLALVQGVSHASQRETTNLAARFCAFAPGLTESAPLAGLSGGTSADIFQIAVLHANVGGAGEGHAPYAPCSLSDLTGAGFDYWALGHVHQGRILHREPSVVYPGSVQGLHINETEHHGCVVAEVDGKDCAIREVPLAPVLWRKIRVRAADTDDEPGTLDELTGHILARLEEEAATCPGATEALFCRVILEGATGLDAALRKPGNAATLLDRLRAVIATSDTPVTVWIKDIALATTPAHDFSLLAERNDLIGEVVRLAGGIKEDPALAADMASSLESLYGHHKLKKTLGAEGESAVPDMAELADSAKSLLCSLLEDE